MPDEVQRFLAGRRVPNDQRLVAIAYGPVQIAAAADDPGAVGAKGHGGDHAGASLEGEEFLEYGIRIGLIFRRLPLAGNLGDHQLEGAELIGPGGRREQRTFKILGHGEREPGVFAAAAIVVLGQDLAVFILQTQIGIDGGFPATPSCRSRRSCRR